MKCYVHQNSDAVGVCSSCGRGVCKVCVIKLQGKIFCKEDATRLFDVKKGIIRDGKDAKVPKRGPVIGIGALFAYLLGGISGLLSFVLIYAGIIGGGVGIGGLTTLLTPDLSIIFTSQNYSGGQLLSLGFGLLVFGSLGVASGYYFFRPTKGGGVAALIFGLFGLVGAFELSSISVTAAIVDPWFAMSGIVIASSLIGLAQMIRAPK